MLVDAAVIKAEIAPWLKLLSDIFLNLIKLLVAPLVLSTIVVGIAHMGDSTALGRIGFRALAWFITASLISIGLGLIMVNLLQPGVNLGIELPDVGASSGIAATGLSLQEFVSHLVPSSIADAMARKLFRELSPRLSWRETPPHVYAGRASARSSAVSGMRQERPRGVSMYSGQGNSSGGS